MVSIKPAATAYALPNPQTIASLQTYFSTIPTSIEQSILRRRHVHDSSPQLAQSLLTRRHIHTSSKISSAGTPNTSNFSPTYPMDARRTNNETKPVPSHKNPSMHTRTTKPHFAPYRGLSILSDLSKTPNKTGSYKSQAEIL
jgi:hypothetical protein